MSALTQHSRAFSAQHVRVRPIRSRWGCAIGLLAISFFSRSAAAHPGVHHDIERVTAALSKDPENVTLLIERGYLNRLDGNYEASLRDLGAAEKLAPDNASVWAHRGMTLASLKRYDEADAELTRFLESGSGSSAAFAERARVRKETGRKEAAIEDYTAAIRLDPNVDLYVERGRLQDGLGRAEEAATGYREGVLRLGNAVILIDALIRCEMRQGKTDEALKLINEQLEKAAVKTDWYLLRAEVFEQTGDHMEVLSDLNLAMAEADQALRRRNTAINLLSRAKVLIALGRMSEAREDLQRAVDKSPRFAEASRLLSSLEEIKRQDNLPLQKKRGVSNVE